ncbi:MAG: hypothetical protein KDA42_13495 [Planctomycetales bacterium]|nr:hypothetical protein [Planctomycetales bacterium]
MKAKLYFPVLCLIAVGALLTWFAGTGHAQRWCCSSYDSHVAWTGTGVYGAGYGVGHMGYSTWGYNYGNGCGYDCCGDHRGHRCGYGGCGSHRGPYCGSGCSAYSSCGSCGQACTSCGHGDCCGGGHCGASGCMQMPAYERTFEWDDAVEPQPPAPPAPAQAAEKTTPRRSRVANVRIWKNAAGKTLAEGRAFIVADGRVGISRSTGGTVTLQIADLQAADRAYLADRTADPQQLEKTPRIASRR